MTDATRPWRLWIDTGGTFTDCIAVDPDGKRRRAKVLSNSSLRGFLEPLDRTFVRVEGLLPQPNLEEGFFQSCIVRPVASESVGIPVRTSRDFDLELKEPWPHGAGESEICSPEEAAVLAARVVTGAAHGSALPECEVRFATTRGTNALLERLGTPPVFFVTRGFRDLLAIGDQRRPDLFALNVRRSEPLYGAVVEVRERLRPDGSVEVPLEAAAIDASAREALEAGFRSAAVALLHSYKNPQHEREVGRRLLELGFEHVSLSSDLSSRLKIVQRAETCVVNAYLADVVGDYLQDLERELGASSLHVMTSAGGLTRSAQYWPKDSLLSGPAGGVIGAISAGRAAAEEKLLAFDMGGTSTDVTRYEGRLEYRPLTVVGEARLSSPSLAVETVAAGGGSLCRFDGRQLKVGPGSAGADPGPACYGKGGPLALTDVNLLLGRLSEEYFPFSVDRQASELRAREVGKAHEHAEGVEVPLERLLFGFLRIANEKMAGAVRRISLRAGFRPSDYVLVTFGGAGPQHACALARLLGIKRILIPTDASLLSADGLGQARLERFAERQVLEGLSAVESSIEQRFEDLEREARSLLDREGVDGEQVAVERREVFLRFLGQESTLAVDWRPGCFLLEEFSIAYEEHFGYRPEGRPLEVESIRLLACGSGESLSGNGLAEDGEAERANETGLLFTESGWLEGPVLSRSDPALRESQPGPAWITEAHTVTVVEPGWAARADRSGLLVLEHS